jgi:hypothetical protein
MRFLKCMGVALALVAGPAWASGQNERPGQAEPVKLTDAELDQVNGGWFINIVNSPINLALVIQINFGDNTIQIASATSTQQLLLYWH